MCWIPWRFVKAIAADCRQATRPLFADWNGAGRVTEPPRLASRRGHCRFVAARAGAPGRLPKLAAMNTPTREQIQASWQSFWNADLPRGGPYWWQLVWTALFAAVLAVPFTIFGLEMLSAGSSAWQDLGRWAQAYGRSLVVSLCIGFIIHALFQGLRRLIGAPRMRALDGWRRTLFFTTVPLAGTAIGLPLGLALIGAAQPARWRFLLSPDAMAAPALLSLTITVALHFFWRARSREVLAQAQATEARLQLLQAQIEPHFLFNTLANVQSLIDYDAARAKQMLEAFTDYLRASLGQLRAGDSSLGAELEMAQRYLQLIQVRMGERLAFTIEADAAARAAVLPPLLVQPLVENAIHHGLESKVEGGQVWIRARVQGGRLEIAIDDHPLPLAPPPP